MSASFKIAPYLWFVQVRTVYMYEYTLRLDCAHDMVINMFMFIRAIRIIDTHVFVL